LKLSSVAILIAVGITILLATFSSTAFQQMVVFSGGIFTVLVITALYIIRVLPDPLQASKGQGIPKPMNDTQIIQAVTSMRGAGYDDGLIAKSLQIDAVVVDAIPRNTSL